MNQTKMKICKSCGTPFPCEDYWNKEYCTLKCRNREKRHRHKARDLNLVMQTASRFFAEVPNPSVTQLDAYAEMVVKERTDDKPVRFYGAIPMWTPPNGLIWKQAEGIEPPEWNMFHPAMVGESDEPMPDVIKQLLGK